MQPQQQKGNLNLGPISQTVDRSARSIFVGNISYDISEEEIKKLLSNCGQIVGFRLVHDRESGRPKGFGFCEFADVQMAETAIRNFNGYELRGRPLRVDSASGADRSMDEQFQMTMIRPQLQQGTAPAPAPSSAPIPEENPYGHEPEAGKAPEVIARTVASMPPEKMFELMRSMKETVNNNPQMARQLLMENPQLSYALLQAQVVMRVVDPKVAYSMLHREHAQPLAPPSMAPPASSSIPQQPFQGPPPHQFNVPPPTIPAFNMPPPSMPSQYFPQQPNMGMQPPNMGMTPMKQRFPTPSFQPQQSSTSVQMAQPVPQQQQPVQSAQQQNNENLDEEQQAQMLVRVLQLTDEQIRMLPPTERAQVIELRNQLRNAGASA